MEIEIELSVLLCLHVTVYMGSNRAATSLANHSPSCSVSSLFALTHLDGRTAVRGGHCLPASQPASTGAAYCALDTLVVLILERVHAAHIAAALL